MDSAYKACSIGIMAYNEEKNIARLLKSIYGQKLKTVKINEIFIVISGCSDNTERIIECFKIRDNRIRLLIQEKREGKASAINLFMKHAISDILIIPSADIFLDADTIEELLKPFDNPKIGMTGVRSIPVNNGKNLISSVSQLQWKINHFLSLRAPKLGEMIAFRKVFGHIPCDTSVDDESIEGIMKHKGYEIFYCPKAIVHNKGPQNMRDFFRQRVRIYAGRTHLFKTLRYRASSFRFKSILQTMLKLDIKPDEILALISLIALEFLSLAAGAFIYLIKKDTLFIWPIAESTKTLSYD